MSKIQERKYSFLYAGSIFYFGYLFAQFLSSYLLQRFPIGKFLFLATIAWGIILINTPACRSFASITINRFLLGAVEATVNPSFVLLIPMWYANAEQPLRLEIYYCTNGIATMFSGLIGYAVGHITTGLPKWMYVFLIFGSISISWGIISLALPDLPSTAKFLTEYERLITVNRVSTNRQGVKNHPFRKYQLIQTIKDPKTWILFIMVTGAQVPNAALTSFTSIIVGSFGFDTLGANICKFPVEQYNSSLFLPVGMSALAGRRIRTMVVANAVCILGLDFWLPSLIATNGEDPWHCGCVTSRDWGLV